MIPTRAYAVHSATDRFQPFAFDRRAPNPNDVAIAIRYCGVCHSDLHTARGEWGGTRYPCVPGHEIVGEVTEVGSAVTRFRPGDLVGVGCMVDSCLRCEPCRDSLEQYCIPGFTGTYNGPTQETRDNTYGGYSDRIVVREEFVLHVRHRPEQLAAVAPLLCAGITTWSPLRHWHAGPAASAIWA
jgi:alcohol dehydrogenase (NADP+)